MKKGIHLLLLHLIAGLQVFFRDVLLTSCVVLLPLSNAAVISVHTPSLSMTGFKFVLFYPETSVVLRALPEEMCQLAVLDLRQSQS